MTHRCKLCGGAVQQRHVIQEIPYYACDDCHLLQNFYWDTQSTPATELTQVNDDIRALKWPAGKKEQMRQKGWEMLEYMYWPLAWKFRSVHELLKKLPPYQQFVRSHVKKRVGTVLDYGCGHGVIVEALRDYDGIAAEGLDPYSPVAASWLKRDPLKQANIPDNHYQGIFSIETFEHIPNMIEDMRELHRILKPGSVLMVQTRRVEDPKYQAQGKDWFYLEDPKAHVQVFSEEAMRVLARLTGFKSVEFRGVTLARFVK